MSTPSDTPRENLTLTEADLAACRPIIGEGGHVLRALCPFHGSDRQRSLRVQVHSRRFVCFACGAWGYMETARAQWGVSGCVKMLENRSFENAGCALGSRRCENAGLQRE